MKQFFYIFSLAVMFIAIGTFHSCKKETTAIDGQIQLSFQTENALKKGDSPDYKHPYAIVVTIADSEGNVIEDKLTMKLLKFGEEYVTKALTLTPGCYQILEYFVIDKECKVIYVTPKESTGLATWVDQPLPFCFTVNKDRVTKLAPEVVSLENYKPEDFGYTTFRLNEVETFNFLIAAFFYQESSTSFELTSAKITVSTGGEVFVKQDIKALTNTITVPDGKEKYDIQIEKSGYKAFEISMTNAELKKHFLSVDKGPLKVYFDKIEEHLTLVTDQNTPKQVVIELETKEKLAIDWGDGSPIEAIEANQPQKHIHDYASTGEYQVKLLGKVSGLTELAVKNSNIKSVDLSKATNLSQVNLKGNLIKTLDLNKLKNLSSLTLEQNRLSSIELTENVKLVSLDISKNPITTLDLSQNTDIFLLKAGGSILSAIDLSTLVKLKTLFMSEAPNMSSLDLSKNIKLEKFSCKEIDIKSLDLSQNTELSLLTCLNAKQLTDINISTNLKLEHLNLNGNISLASLDVTKNSNLKSLLINNTGIKKIDISANVGLTHFSAKGCFLEELDINDNTKLKEICLLGNTFTENIMNDFYITLFDHVITNNIKNGVLLIKGVDPTGEALNDKTRLTDDYDWQIKTSI